MQDESNSMATSSRYTQCIRLFNAKQVRHVKPFPQSDIQSVKKLNNQNTIVESHDTSDSRKPTEIRITGIDDVVLIGKRGKWDIIEQLYQREITFIGKLFSCHLSCRSCRLLFLFCFIFLSLFLVFFSLFHYLDQRLLCSGKDIKKTK